MAFFFVIFVFICFNPVCYAFVNSTGIYFIATQRNSFKNQLIECNSTYNLCYIGCPLKQSCQNTTIQCSSNYCHLECNELSCNQLNMNVNYSNVVDINCDKSGCKYITISGNNYNNKWMNTSFNINCNGDSSCSNSTFIPNNYQNINIKCISSDSCSDTLISVNSSALLSSSDQSLFSLNCTSTHSYSCNNTNISISSYSYTNISCLTGGCNHLFTNLLSIKNMNIICKECVKSFWNIMHDIDDDLDNGNIDILCDDINGFGGCQDSLFIFPENNNYSLSLNCSNINGCVNTIFYDISPYINNTNLICFTTSISSYNSGPCDKLQISVPPVYESNFLTINMVNNSNSNQYININCTTQLCRPHNLPFPIIDASPVIPTEINSSGIYYYGNQSYIYQYSQIMCNKSLNCYVFCNEFASCSKSYIKCRDGCYISSNNTNATSGSYIESIGNEKLIIGCNDGCEGLMLNAKNDAKLLVICTNNYSCYSINITLDKGYSTSAQYNIYNRYNTGNSVTLNCMGNYSCSNGLIIAKTNVYNDLDIECYGDYSCQYSTIISPNNQYGSLNLDCYGFKSCYNASIYCNSPNKDSCDITCVNNNNNVSYACLNTTIYIPSTFDNNFLNVYQSCNNKYSNTLQSCNGMTFQCKNNNFTNYIYSSSKNEYECDSLICCPWNFNQTIFNCNSQDPNDCNIHCNGTDTLNPYLLKSGCSYGIIDGSKVNQIYIFCPNLNDCMNTNIICPNSTKSICEIHCTGNLSCYNSIINAQYTYNFFLECNHGCNTLVINASYSDSFRILSRSVKNINQSITKMINMEIYVNYTKNVSIDSRMTGSNGLNVYGTNARKVYMYCNGTNNCDSNQYYLQNVTSLIHFECNGYLSCNNSIIYAQYSNKLYFILSSNQKNLQNITLHTPYYHHSTSINCRNYGCYMLNLYLWNNLNDLNVSYKGNCTNKWINNWDITCVTDNQIIDFDGKQCSNYQSECCNKTDANNINQMYQEICPQIDNSSSYWQLILLAFVIFVIMIVIFVLSMVLGNRKIVFNQN